ncbi:MAG TPA: ABC transporter ATP-binding protein [Aggregatilineales bacterium]|nr:ABC transporter ATP-binding protein [Aggregatilineales bacterium]
MIEAEGLTKYFEDFLAVEDFTLTVEPGTVVAILGPNGAGKTTTVRMLTSILKPSGGWARVAGYDVTQQAAQVRASVGVLTEQHGLYERMKGPDYLEFFARIYNLPPEIRRERGLQLMQRFGLGMALDKRVGEYSKGMKQKLALVRAMLHDPPVLLLDEPTSAMDPQSARQVRDAILELRRDKRTVVLTTHNLTEAQELSDRIAVIRQGRIIAHGTFEQLAEQFVGPSLMRLQLTQHVNGLAEDLREIVRVEASGDDWIDYVTPEPVKTNPQILRRVMDKGYDVLTLSQRSRTLEDVYLKIVQEDENRVGVSR